MSARAVVLGTMVVGAGLVVISTLADETLTVHETTPPDSRTAVVVHGSIVDDAEFDVAEGVEGLVRVCQLEVGRNVGPDPLEALGGDRFRFELRPALDDADQDQLRGCIGDMVVDHLQASVETMDRVG